MTVGSTHGRLQSGWTLRLARSWWWPLSLQPKLQGHSPVPHFLLFHRTSHNLTYVLLVCLLSLVPQTMTEEWKLLEGEKFVLFVVISLVLRRIPGMVLNDTTRMQNPYCY